MKHNEQHGDRLDKVYYGNKNEECGKLKPQYRAFGSKTIQVKTCEGTWINCMFFTNQHSRDMELIRFQR